MEKIYPKKRAKKEKLDFSPQKTYDPKSNPLPPFNSKDIHDIKDHFKFKKDFNLLKELEKLRNYYRGFIFYDKSTPRPAHKKKILKNLLIQTEGLQESWDLLDIVTKTEVSVALNKKIKLKGVFEFLQELLSSNLQLTKEVISNIITNLPKDPGGPKKRTIKRNVIFHLLIIFKKGTDLPPVIYNDPNGGYRGIGYKFLCSCRHFFKLGTNSSIGEIALEIWRKEKNKIK